MWSQVKNKTGDLSQRALQQLPGAAETTVTSDGHTSAPLPSQTSPPVGTATGIIPGCIAAAIFISFLLALYAVLWKCMSAAPKRREKRKTKVMIREKVQEC